jgi:hypothetical protein
LVTALVFHILNIIAAILIGVGVSTLLAAVFLGYEIIDTFKYHLVKKLVIMYIIMPFVIIPVLNTALYSISASMGYPVRFN